MTMTTEYDFDRDDCRECGTDLVDGTVVCDDCWFEVLDSDERYDMAETYHESER